MKNHADLEVIKAHVSTHVLLPIGEYPNNEKFPVLVYKGPIFMHPDEDGQHIGHIFERNGWTGTWEGDIYDFDHYHASTHEVLGISRGVADVQFGGPEGVCVELSRGDVVVIPAGVSHRKIKSSDDFECVGAYPVNGAYSISKPGEHAMEEQLEKIAHVGRPTTDPVYGSEGGLLACWTF